ncbi:hypothetical protein Tco_0267850 [Tanacetum coccineum]
MVGPSSEPITPINQSGEDDDKSNGCSNKRWTVRQGVGSTAFLMEALIIGQTSENRLWKVTKIMRRVDDFIKSEEVLRTTEFPKGEFLDKGKTHGFWNDQPAPYAHRGDRSQVEETVRNSIGIRQTVEGCEAKGKPKGNLKRKLKGSSRGKQRWKGKSHQKKLQG